MADKFENIGKSSQADSSAYDGFVKLAYGEKSAASAADDCGCDGKDNNSTDKKLVGNDDDPCFGFVHKDDLPTGPREFLERPTFYVTDRNVIFDRGRRKYGFDVRDNPSLFSVEYGESWVRSAMPKGMSKRCLERSGWKYVHDNSVPDGKKTQEPAIVRESSYGVDVPVESQVESNNKSYQQSREKFVSSVKEAFDRSPKGRLIMSYHGAAHSHDKTILDDARLGNATKSVVLSYDWTAQDDPVVQFVNKFDLLGYAKDENNYSLAVPKFQAIDADIRSVIPGDKIIRVAHSLGNRELFTQTYFHNNLDARQVIGQLAKVGQVFKEKNLPPSLQLVVVKEMLEVMQKELESANDRQHQAAIWVSADINGAYFKQHASKLAEQGAMNIIIYSPLDRALGLSEFVHGGKPFAGNNGDNKNYRRLGQDGLDVDLPGFVNLDTSAIIKRTDPGLRHGQDNNVVNILVEHVIANDCKLAALLCKDCSGSDAQNEIKVHNFVFKRKKDTPGNHWSVDFVDHKAMSSVTGAKAVKAELIPYSTADLQRDRLDLTSELEKDSRVQEIISKLRAPEKEWEPEKGLD